MNALRHEFCWPARRECDMNSPSSASAVLEAPESVHASVRERIGSSLDDGLDPGSRRQADRHLARCALCLAFANAFGATVEAVRSLPREQFPETARRRLLSLIDQEE
jgi:hypothetical protein